jgi:hypothetical protein
MSLIDSTVSMSVMQHKSDGIIDNIIAILRKELKFQDEYTVENLCSLCLCESENPVSYCHESHAVTCRDCIGNFITHTVTESSNGLCPTLWCPVCKSTKKNRVLQFPKWSAEKSFEQAFKKYINLAQSVLTLKCKGCHTNRNLLVPQIKYTDIIFSQEFLNDVNMYEIGILEINIFYKKIIDDYVINFDKKVCNKELAKTKFAKYGTKLTNGNLVDEFHFLLSVIENPERRLNLQLRFYRDYPEVNSICCTRPHCFKCKTSYHTGKTCAQMEGAGKDTKDNDIIDCPQCGISLVKGDGCSAIHCFCGKEFNWDVEKERVLEITRFLRMYEDDFKAGRTADNIHDYCAKIVWTDPSARHALNWFKRHPETFFSVFKIMTKDFGMYTSHVCATVEGRSMNFSDVLMLQKAKCMELAMQHFKKINPKEYQLLSTKYASRGEDLFSSMYQENDRLVGYAQMMSEYTIHTKEFKSVLTWVFGNLAACKTHVQKVNLNKFMQFCITRGNNCISQFVTTDTMKFKESGAAVTPGLTDYTYTNSGSRSKITFSSRFGIPVSFAVTGITDEFYIGADHGPDGCYVGINITSGRLNLYHESTGGGHAHMETTYIFPANEVITMVTNRSPLTLEIRLHSCNAVFKYKITNIPEDAVKYAIMLPRNASVNIINNPYKYHTEIAKHLAWVEVISMLKDVVTNINDDSFDYVIPENIIREAAKSKYVKYESEILDKSSVHAIIDLIENNFSTINDVKDKEDMQKMSWYDVLHCLTKYCEIKQSENNISEEDRATEFLMENIDDPAFSAILVIHGIRKVSKREHRCATAYMNCNPEFVEYAYQLDAENKEPVIYGLRRGCLCLPRHTKMQECSTCPVKSGRTKESEESDEEEPREERDEDDEPHEEREERDEDDEPHEEREERDEDDEPREEREERDEDDEEPHFERNEDEPEPEEAVPPHRTVVRNEEERAVLGALTAAELTLLGFREHVVEVNEPEAVVALPQIPVEPSTVPIIPEINERIVERIRIMPFQSRWVDDSNSTEPISEPVQEPISEPIPSTPLQNPSYSSRHGQMGTVGILLPEIDMSFGRNRMNMRMRMGEMERDAMEYYARRTELQMNQEVSNNPRVEQLEDDEEVPDLVESFEEAARGAVYGQQDASITSRIIQGITLKRRTGILQIETNNDPRVEQLESDDDEVPDLVDNFDSLNDRGYVPEELQVEHGDIIFGKVTPITHEQLENSSEPYNPYGMYQLRGRIVRGGTRGIRDDFTARTVTSSSSDMPYVDERSETDRNDWFDMRTNHVTASEIPSTYEDNGPRIEEID